MKKFAAFVLLLGVAVFSIGMVGCGGGTMSDAPAPSESDGDAGDINEGEGMGGEADGS